MNIEDKLGDYYLMEPTAFNLLNINGLGNGISDNTGFNLVTNPFLNNPISIMPDFFNDFSMTNSFPAFNNDFMTTFTMFNSFLNGQMPMLWQNRIFDTNFNTNTNLPQLSAVKYDKTLGNSLANIAYKNAVSKNSKHKCLQGVRESLNKQGLVDGTMGSSAYQAAAVLKNNKNFREVSVSREDLKNLPAGCVIVWDRNYVGTSSADIHGHITVTLGNGSGACDRVEKKLFMLNTKHRVFVPVASGINKTA